MKKMEKREENKVILFSTRIIFTFTWLRQVSQDGKSLLDKLQRPLTPGSADSLMASANYSKAVHHVLDIIHEVLHHQRQLENIWQHRKVRLHQRLQLCVFQQDVQQVRHKVTPAEGFVYAFLIPKCISLIKKHWTVSYLMFNMCIWTQN